MNGNNQNRFSWCKLQRSWNWERDQANENPNWTKLCLVQVDSQDQEVSMFKQDLNLVDMPNLDFSKNYSPIVDDVTLQLLLVLKLAYGLTAKT